MKKELKPGYSRYSVIRYTLTGAEKCSAVRNVHTEEVILKDTNDYFLDFDQPYKKLKNSSNEQTFIKTDRIITTGKKTFKFDIGSSINCVYTFLFTKI
jgi:hypothetical protein